MAILAKGDGGVNTLIGEKSFFEGRFMVKGSLQIDGKFEGQMLDVDHLKIGPKGKVKSDIYSSTVVIEGMVIGNIEAKNRVFLMPTAKIYGNIRTPELIIQNGVILEGNCHISKDLKTGVKDLLEKLYIEKD
jgi:cytoskeletal protein CcmA (bactofilin family)